MSDQKFALLFVMVIREAAMPWSGFFNKAAFVVGNIIGGE